MRIKKMNEDIQWICPICQSTEYKEIISNLRPLSLSKRTIISYYECNGCSIHFGNLKKFNAIEIISEVADKLLSEHLKTGD